MCLFAFLVILHRCRERWGNIPLTLASAHIHAGRLDSQHAIPIPNRATVTLTSVKIASFDHVDFSTPGASIDTGGIGEASTGVTQDASIDRPKGRSW